MLMRTALQSVSEMKKRKLWNATGKSPEPLSAGPSTTRWRGGPTTASGAGEDGLHSVCKVAHEKPCRLVRELVSG